MKDDKEKSVTERVLDTIEVISNVYDVVTVGEYDYTGSTHNTATDSIKEYMNM